MLDRSSLTEPRWLHQRRGREGYKGKEWVPFRRFEICKRAHWQMHKSAHKHWAPSVMAAAWVLEGRHCGHTGLSGNIKWPSHGSPLAWVVWLVLVFVDRDGYTLVPQRWVERMRVVAKGGSAGQTCPHMEGHLTILIKRHKHDRRPCGANIWTETGRRCGVSTL